LQNFAVGGQTLSSGDRPHHRGTGPVIGGQALLSPRKVASNDPQNSTQHSTAPTTVIDRPHAKS